MKLAKMGSYGEVKAQKKESRVKRDLPQGVLRNRTQTVANRETSIPSDRFEPTQYGFAPVKSSPVLIASRELPRALPRYIDVRSIPQLQSQQNIYSPSPVGAGVGCGVWGVGEGWTANSLRRIEAREQPCESEQPAPKTLRQSPLEEERTQTTESTISETTPTESTSPRRDRFASRPLSDSLVDVRAIKKATIKEQSKTSDAIEEENLMRSIEQNNLSSGFPSDNYDRSLEINTNEETSILEGRSPQMLQIGQQVQAHLLTPVMWAEDNKDNLAAGQEHFMVQLDQPIVDVRGREVVGAGSQLVFEIGSIHESGLVISKAVSLIKDGVEYALPPEVIKIRGNSGNALIAKLHKTDDGDGFDVAMFGLGALSKVGEIMNRPKSTFSSSSIYGQSSSSNYGDANYLGAILEGGLQPMLDGALQERQSQRQQQNRDSWFWTLDAGQTVQVIINNSFEL